MSVCCGCLNKKREMMILDDVRLNRGFLQLVDMKAMEKCMVKPRLKSIEIKDIFGVIKKKEDLLFPIILCAYCRVLLKNYLTFKSGCIKSMSYLKKKNKPFDTTKQKKTIKPKENISLQQESFISKEDFNLDHYLTFFKDREAANKRIQQVSNNTETPAVEVKESDESDLNVTTESNLELNSQEPIQFQSEYQQPVEIEIVYENDDVDDTGDTFFFSDSDADSDDETSSKYVAVNDTTNNTDVAASDTTKNTSIDANDTTNNTYMDADNTNMDADDTANNTDMDADDTNIDSDDTIVIISCEEPNKSDVEDQESPCTTANTNSVNLEPSENSEVGFVEIVLSRVQQLKELENIQQCAEFKNAPFKCHMCSLWYKNRASYLKHSLKHQLVCGRYICDICTQRFNSIFELGNHQLEHSRRFTCSKCDVTCNKRIDIVSHIKYEHKELL